MSFNDIGPVMGRTAIVLLVVQCIGAVAISDADLKKWPTCDDGRWRSSPHDLVNGIHTWDPSWDLGPLMVRHWKRCELS